MNREEAKIWAKIQREYLKIIAPNIDKHFDILRAYANGEDIEINDLGSWTRVECPSFIENEEYRVKPSVKQFVGTWSPKYGEQYFFLSYDGEVVESHWIGSLYNMRGLEMGNCFRSREEAEAARERVRSALKGKTISKVETTKSIYEKSNTVQLTNTSNPKDGDVFSARLYDDRLDVERSKFENSFLAESECKSASEGAQEALKGSLYDEEKDLIEDLFLAYIDGKTFTDKYAYLIDRYDPWEAYDWSWINDASNY